MLSSVEIGPVVLERIFKFHQTYFHYFVIISHSFEKTWVLITQGCVVPSLFEIGPVVLEKKMKMWKVYDNDNRQDKFWSEKLTWAFGSGKLIKILAYKEKPKWRLGAHLPGELQNVYTISSSGVFKPNHIQNKGPMSIIIPKRLIYFYNLVPIFPSRRMWPFIWKTRFTSTQKCFLPILVGT